MNRFVLKNIFVKVHISLFNKYFYKNKNSKLCFGDCVPNTRITNIEGAPLHSKKQNVILGLDLAKKI
jgi:hypothetical protein